MAVEDVKCSGGRKRKRKCGKSKLLVNERVEVRSFEEGFLGSWHPATVIQCGKLKRHVRYDNVLDGGGSNYLHEVVTVSAALEGDSSSNRKKRGIIRPHPPSIKFGEWDLPFGTCVDVSYQEAWWEGVVFDYCDGMNERNIFFPDLGDEMKIGIGLLRITQDWDEVRENWERRGHWAFLELVEECEKASFIAVSLKQLWYDVRQKKQFDMIGDWIFNVKDLWRDVVTEVVRDYYTLTVKEVFSVLNLPIGFLKETLALAPVESTANVDHNQGVDMANFPTIVNSGSQLSCNTNVCCDASPNNAFCSDIGMAGIPMERSDQSDMLDTVQKCGSSIPIHDKYDMDTSVEEASDMHIMADLNMTFPERKALLREEHDSPAQEVLPEFQKQITSYDAAEVVSRARCNRKKSEHRWQPLTLSDVEFCPDAVKQYALVYKNKVLRDLWKTKVQKHLAYLGWDIEQIKCQVKHGSRYREQNQFRYKSPDKQDQKVYESLLEVCKVMHPTADTHLSHLLLDQSKKSNNVDVFPPVMPPPSVKPEFCPAAIVEYCSHALERGWVDGKKWKMKAKNHLLAEGWTLKYPDNSKRGISYISPQNRTFTALIRACRSYMKGSIPKWTVPVKKPVNVSIISKENVNQVDCGDLLLSGSKLLQKEPELHTTDDGPVGKPTGNEKRKQKRMANSKDRLPKCKRNGLPLRVLRSSKRVQKVFTAYPSHHKPQNVLSWLIDSNIVLPRSKVYYKSKGRHHHVAKGRITCEGIRCDCCKKVYSLAGFGNHASGGSNCRPAARIFLEDGRSLLDCQMQKMHDHRTRKILEKACDDLCQGENDNICSVCHYGGELILCDQCPSSFHKTCLGLEDIPSGDWFCPSCRCGICGQSKINGAEDGNFLTCIQCEHKYHVSCLRNRVDQSRRFLENWFCGKDCEKIYAGLQKLLGKSVPVGVDNLTWTLVKCFSSESCGLGCTDNELLADSNSKLSVALSVMHECFEPLKEPSSGRDLMEDVIFSRWSKLNRLNFRGFYTILLERNEELISVATVRVYGEKVAEVPLVATRLQYRRLGMCSILMDELEKKLMQLGVERVVLVAVPSVLETWINSFGFRKMASFERSHFLDYTFLEFPGSIMCQKLLMKIPSPDSVLPRESPLKPHDAFSVRCSINFQKSSPESEVCQAETMDNSETMDLQMADNLTDNNDGGRSIDLVTTVEEQSHEGQEGQNGITPFKYYYKRRKIREA